MRLENASAAEVVRVDHHPRPGRQDRRRRSQCHDLVADERTNSVLVSGDRNERLRLRTLVAHLDTPLQEGGDTRVRYLRYADAKELATKLQSQYQKQARTGGRRQERDPAHREAAISSSGPTSRPTR